MEESAAAVDAISREIATEISRRLMGSPPALATMSFVEALGPLRPFFLPVITPLELLNRYSRDPSFLAESSITSLAHSQYRRQYLLGFDQVWGSTSVPFSPAHKRFV